MARLVTVLIMLHAIARVGWSTEVTPVSSKESPDMATFTWERIHPEVAAAFAAGPTGWRCEKIETGLRPVYQPSVTIGADQEILVAGNDGEVFHSTDGGRTWSLLCTSPSFQPDVPEPFKLDRCATSGIGISRDGALLVVWAMEYSDGGRHSTKNETCHRLTWVTRSEDRGKTWHAAAPLDPSPYQIGVDQATIIQLRDGKLMVPIRVQAWSRPGKPVDDSEAFFRSFLYTSNDDGRTWSNFSKFTDHSPEPHLLELPSGRIVASVRYQRDKTPDDPIGLATPFPRAPNTWPKGCTTATDIGQTVFQTTALTSSEDGGRTWSTPKIIAGTQQQSGSVLRLSDATLIVTFGRWGQRFVLSYDEGRTWSRTIYELNRTGEYARSVVLADDTIVTVHDGIGDGERGRLCVLRWRAPMRAEVEKNGFFTPREAEEGLQCRAESAPIHRRCR